MGESGYDTSAGFATTRWTFLAEAASTQAPGAREALEQLCRAYWPPLYAYARRRGQPPNEAQDLVQSFFLHLLETRLLASADRRRGRFRSYLLACFSNFMASQWSQAAAQKRGGGIAFVPLDSEVLPELDRRASADGPSPEQTFDIEWALSLIARARQALRAEAAERGKQTLLAELEPFLAFDPEPSDATTHAAAAGRLGVAVPAFKTSLHRLRLRFRECIRAEVARTVETPAEVDDEMRHLQAMLQLARRGGF